MNAASRSKHGHGGGHGGHGGYGGHGGHGGGISHGSTKTIIIKQGGPSSHGGGRHYGSSHGGSGLPPQLLAAIASGGHGSHGSHGSHGGYSGHGGLDSATIVSAALGGKSGIGPDSVY